MWHVFSLRSRENLRLEFQDGATEHHIWMFASCFTTVIIISSYSIILYTRNCMQLLYKFCHIIQSSDIIVSYILLVLMILKPTASTI